MSFHTYPVPTLPTLFLPHTYPVSIKKAPMMDAFRFIKA